MISAVPVAMIYAATELPGLQRSLLTVGLSGGQWLECIGLALALPIVVEVAKLIRRTRATSSSSDSRGR